MSKPSNEPLFETFPPVSTEKWEEKIEQVLNGSDYKEKLCWHTGEGIAPLPFYRQEDLSTIDRNGPIQRKGGNDWEICAPIASQDISQAGKEAQKKLENGAEALQFQLKVYKTKGTHGVNLEGTNIQGQEDVTELFEHIELQHIPVHFDAGLASPALLAMLANETQRREQNADTIQATFTYDPFSYLLQHGQYPKKRDDLKKDIPQIADFSTQHLPYVRPFGIDGRLYHQCGATIVQELGYGLAAASEYLAALTEHNIPITEAVDLLNFNFSVGSAYFPEIAKLRAARLLWRNLIEAYGANPDEHKAYLHAETSSWNKTIYDPYTNMLRSTTEGMAAAIAGADAITVRPFDQHFRQPDDFSMRIAKNQQLILEEEAFMDKVADPAAGSYYIEQLTDQIGAQAWMVFQEVEKEGGLFRAAEEGFVQTAIQESQKERDRAITHRERSFVGTSRFTNPGDTMAENIGSGEPISVLRASDTDVQSRPENRVQYLSDAFKQGANIADIMDRLFGTTKQLYRTISPYRGPEEYESLRLATEKSDFRPTVLNLPLGNPKIRKARSSFSNNFFGCVGYDIVDPIGFNSVDDAVEAIKDETPDIAVICSSDPEYEQLVPQLCQQLKQTNQQPLLVLTGLPKEQVDTYKKEGVNLFIHSGSNVLETLTEVQQKLGIVKS